MTRAITPETPAERLYALVANEEDARLCTDIPDSACREVPGNFFRMLASLVMTNVGDLLASPKIVLAWLLGAVGAPAALVSWLVPVRESGSLIPQLLIGAWVRRHARRAGFWVLGSVAQGACVAGMAGAVWWLEGAAAGWAVIGLLVLFSLARGVCSVAMKDVQGKCIPKARRGRLSGLASTAAGLAVLALSVALFGQDSEPSRAFYAALLLTAGALWVVAATIFSRVDEYEGETAGGRDVFDDLARSTSLLVTDVPFRRFVITRALLMCSALSAPFLVVLAQRGAPDARLLGAFLLAGSLASTVSASFWGWMADDSSRRVMTLGGAVAAAVCLATAALGWMVPDLPSLGWLIAAAYFVLSIAHSGVRIGRKTYLVDMAGGNKRTDYVAVSNTTIGFALLAVGGLSGLASLVSVETALVLLGAMGVAGVVSAVALREV